MLARRSSWRKLLLSMILPMALVSCSSGSSSGSSSPSPGTQTTGTQTTATTPAAKVVKVGVIAPLDAGLVDFGHGIRNSVQLAVDQANARNAIPGWTIVVEAVDDSSDPDKGEAAAKKLAADPQVIGVVGPYNSGVAAKAAPVLGQAGITLISPSNTNPTLTLGPDPANPVRPNATYFRMVGSDIAQAAFLADEAKRELGASKVAIVSETKPVSSGLADNFATDFRAKGGEVVLRQIVPDGDSDFSAFLAAAKPLDPSLIFFGGEYPVAAELRHQASTAGLTVPIMGGDGMKDDAFITDAGPESAGDLASSVGAPADRLASARDYLAAYGAAGFDDPPTDYGPFSYDAANLLIDASASALANTSVVDAAARTSVLDIVQSIDESGASGPIAFDAYGDARRPSFTLYVVREDGGKLVWRARDTATVG